MASKDFDPYYKWLAIPKHEQPPNHYRLLGLPLFESDPDVILSSMDRQMAHVKSQATGKHVELSQQLLRELAEAGRCLMESESKGAYDAVLREQLKQKRLAAQTRRTAQQPLAPPAGPASPPLSPAPAGGFTPLPPFPAPPSMSVTPSPTAPGGGVFGPAPGQPPPPPTPPPVALTLEDLETGGHAAPAIDFRKGKKRGETELDMTPMVDVTFLLLIFFMVTASFSMQKSLTMPTPNEDSKKPSLNTIEELEEDPQYVMVRIDEHNAYTVETPDWDAEVASEHDLLIKLREVRQMRINDVQPSKLLIIANVDSLHEKAVAVIDMGMEVGMEQVQMTTVEDDTQ